MCVAPTSLAVSTSFFAMSGRPRAVKSGYFPPYSAFAFIAGDVLSGELRLRVPHEGVSGAYLERLRLYVLRRLPLAEVQIQRVGLRPLLLEPLDADRSVQAARVGEYDLLSFQHDPSRNVSMASDGNWFS